jgi:hypothetical protein
MAGADGSNAGTTEKDERNAKGKKVIFYPGTWHLYAMQLIE